MSRARGPEAEALDLPGLGRRESRVGSGTRTWRAQDTDSRAPGGAFSLQVRRTGRAGPPQQAVAPPRPARPQRPQARLAAPSRPPASCQALWIASGRLRAGRKSVLELLDRQTDPPSCGSSASAGKRVLLLRGRTMGAPPWAKRRDRYPCKELQTIASHMFKTPADSF